MPYALCLGVRYDVRSAFFFTDMPPTFIYTLSLHDALPICQVRLGDRPGGGGDPAHPQRWADLPDQLRWWRRAARRGPGARDRKSTRLNSSHVAISYAVFCLKKKKTIVRASYITERPW